MADQEHVKEYTRVSETGQTIKVKAYDRIGEDITAAVVAVPGRPPMAATPGKFANGRAIPGIWPEPPPIPALAAAPQPPDQNDNGPFDRDFLDQALGRGGPPSALTPDFIGQVLGRPSTKADKVVKASTTLLDPNTVALADIHVEGYTRRSKTGNRTRVSQYLREGNLFDPLGRMGARRGIVVAPDRAPDRAPAPPRAKRMDPARWQNEDCALFAEEAHNRTGWPIVAVADQWNESRTNIGWMHVVVQRPDGRYVDSLGVHTADDLFNAWEEFTDNADGGPDMVNEEGDIDLIPWTLEGLHKSLGPGRKQVDADTRTMVDQVMARQPRKYRPADAAPVLPETAPPPLDNLPVIAMDAPKLGSAVAHDGQLFLRDKNGERPLTHVYRAVSEAEWHAIAETGYIASDGRMNLDPGEGTVTSVHDPSFYLPNAPGTRGRVLKISVRPEDGWRVDPSDDYVKSNQQIPSDRIEAVTDWSVGYGTGSGPVSAFPAMVTTGLANYLNGLLYSRPDYGTADDPGYQILSDRLWAARNSVPPRLDADGVRMPYTTEEALAYLDALEEVFPEAEENGLDVDDIRATVDAARRVLRPNWEDSIWPPPPPTDEALQAEFTRVLDAKPVGWTFRAPGGDFYVKQENGRWAINGGTLDRGSDLLSIMITPTMTGVPATDYLNAVEMTPLPPTSVKTYEHADLPDPNITAAIDDSGFEPLDLAEGWDRDAIAAALREQMRFVPDPLAEVMGIMSVTAGGQSGGNRAYASSDILAYVDMDDRPPSMHLNDLLVAPDFDEASRAATLSGFHPTGTDSFQGTINHEFGHFWHGYMLQHASPELRAKFYTRLNGVLTWFTGDDPSAIDTPAELQAFIDRHQKVFREQLSQYGATDEFELLGEAWSEFTTSPNPRPLALAIGSAMQQMLIDLAAEMEAAT